MRNKLEKQIKESVIELQAYKKRSQNHRIKTRIESLILIKSNNYIRLSDIAVHLSIGLRTLKRWYKTYTESGLEGLSQINNGGKRFTRVSTELHEALREKTHNAEDPFVSYKEAVVWVEEHHNQTIKYTTLRSYLINNFGTKLKLPRRSHYLSDKEEVDSFKKTSQPA